MQQPMRTFLRAATAIRAELVRSASLLPAVKLPSEAWKILNRLRGRWPMRSDEGSPARRGDCSTSWPVRRSESRSTFAWHLPGGMVSAAPRAADHGRHLP